jgi:hypothetical protein
MWRGRSISFSTYRSGLEKERSASLDASRNAASSSASGIHAAHALAAAAGHRFQQQGIAEPRGERAGFGGTAERFVSAGHHRRARGDGHLARGGLRAHAANGLGRRADEDDAGRFAGGGEIRILAEEAVAGVDGLGAMLARGVQNAVGAQIAFGEGEGPTHSASSAMRTCSDVRSASEKTATEAISISRSVRITRTAISPRLAIRTLRNIQRL